jgi:hypothetical protein
MSSTLGMMPDLLELSLDSAVFGFSSGIYPGGPSPLANITSLANEGFASDEHGRIVSGKVTYVKR